MAACQIMVEFIFATRPKNRRLPLLVLAFGCTAALIALDKSAETEKRLATAQQQVARISRDIPIHPAKLTEADEKKSTLAKTIQTSLAVDWNRRLGRLESLSGEAVWVSLLKLTAMDAKAELRLMSDTLEAANSALDRYARAAGDEMRPTVTSIALRDRRYVTTASVPVRP